MMKKDLIFRNEYAKVYNCCGVITERIVTNVNRSDGPLAPIDGV